MTSMDNDIRFPKHILSRISERLIKRAYDGLITWKDCSDTLSILARLSNN